MPNIVPFKNRTIDLQKPVRVYRNLTMGLTDGLPWYSIMQGSKIVGHSQYLMLVDCKFIVSEAGRQRVIREKKKYVHAFIQGEMSNTGAIGMFETDNRPLPVKISYNPYKGDKFVAYQGGVGNPAQGALAVCINCHGVTAAYVS